MIATLCDLTFAQMSQFGAIRNLNTTLKNLPAFEIVKRGRALLLLKGRFTAHARVNRPYHCFSILAKAESRNAGVLSVKYQRNPEVFGSEFRQSRHLSIRSFVRDSFCNAI